MLRNMLRITKNECKEAYIVDAVFSVLTGGAKNLYIEEFEANQFKERIDMFVNIAQTNNAVSYNFIVDDASTESIKYNRELLESIVPFNISYIHTGVYKRKVIDCYSTYRDLLDGSYILGTYNVCDLMLNAVNDEGENVVIFHIRLRRFSERYEVATTIYVQPYKDEA